VTLRGDISHKGSQFLTAADPTSYQGSYTLVGARIAWEPSFADGLEVSLDGTNLTKTNYAYYKATLPPTGAYVAIPVRFSISMSRTPRTTQWSAYEPGPIHPAPWAAVQGQERIAQLGNDDTISTSSRFHLKDDVIGKAL
jgi:hypothetical protein